MPCVRCQGHRDAMARVFGTGAPGLPKPDPVLEMPKRSHGEKGHRLRPPEGFEPPRVCLDCGVVYCPKKLSEVARDG